MPLEKSYFRPHHGVLKPSSLTSKLWTVCNGSSRTSNGFSLNDLFYTGPNLLPELLNLVIDWRAYKNVFITDIQKMYRQIRVYDDDTHYQAIVWRFNWPEPLQVYLNTRTYGLISSPCQATRTLHQLTDRGEEYPLAKKVVQNECYMDDMLTGSHSMSNVLEKQSQLFELLKVGEMSLRKWVSNYPELLSRLASDHLAAEPDVVFQSSLYLRCQVYTGKRRMIFSVLKSIVVLHHTNLL